MTNPGWVITRDFIADTNAPEGTNLNAKGIVGPGGYDGGTDTTALPIKFRLLDDDDEVYYHGRCNEAAIDDFGIGDPLHCFGAPNAGAVKMDIMDNGNWKAV